MHEANPNVVFPKVVRWYYKEGAINPAFPWNKRKRLETEELVAEFKGPAAVGKPRV